MGDRYLRWVFGILESVHEILVVVFMLVAVPVDTVPTSKSDRLLTI